MCPLAVHAAVLDQTACRAILELDGVTPELAAVGACTTFASVHGCRVHNEIVGASDGVFYSNGGGELKLVRARYDINISNHESHRRRL